MTDDEKDLLEMFGTYAKVVNHNEEVLDFLIKMEYDNIEFPKEFLDVVKVLDMGAKKYGANSWLKGKDFNHRANHASMSRHLAEHYVKKDKDDESGLDPLLHLACRALMAYTLKRRGLM